MGSKRTWRSPVLAGGACVLCAVCAGAPGAVVTLPYVQDFSGAGLGHEWSASGGRWRLVDGRLFNDGAHNVPLWLRASLPRDVRVEFDAVAMSEDVDIKVELFGDGLRHESGYVVILGGWNNSKSIIARRDEHGRARRDSEDARLREESARDPTGTAERYADVEETVERRGRLQARQRYRVVVERRGGELRVLVDGEPHLAYFDPAPLWGPDQDRFAFNNWQSTVYFDDLRIEAL